MSSASPHLERAPAAQTSAARTRIGEKYRSLYVVGRGGMGLVEVALELEGAGRVVALKRLLPEGANDRRLSDMFLREARLARMLSHPNVVHAFDFGEVDGELFLAMEYVEGEPLSRVLTSMREREGRADGGASLAPALAAHILAEICVGLHAAHDLADANGTMLNVVHRDVSPHNVMLGYDGRIKLLDFGVAKTDAEGGLTRTGEVKGKVAYMSPEQAMSDALDRRSDLYSIGAVLFECVAGRRMWLGTDMEVLRQLALDQPPKLEDFAADAPPELCALYTRLVARDPRGRPESAAVVAAELRAFVAARDPSAGSCAIEALMDRLFPGAAAARREEVERAIEAGPEAASRTEMPDVPSVAGTVSGAHVRPTSRVFLAGGVIAGIALFGVGGAIALSSRGASLAPTPATSATPAPSASVAPAPSATSLPSPSASPSATPSSPPLRTAAPRSKPASTRPHSTAPPAASKPAQNSPPSKHIDVDPDPI